MGDFTGFKFGGVHSSELGITRVSGGDRYDEQLYPEIKDRTAEVPGLNGEYYFGSDFGTRTFDIEIAFDSLTEYQFRQLRRIFGTKDIKELIFDERPYKKYLVKIESPIELSYVCFDEPNYTWDKIELYYDEETHQTVYAQGISGDFEYKNYDDTTRHVYKGEGKISFVAYFPFAKSVYKEIPSAERGSDWVLSSGILNSTEYEAVDSYRNSSITVYNPGDVATGFRLYIPAEVAQHNITLIYTNLINQTLASLVLLPITILDDEEGILIDTNNGLIIGVSSAPVLNQNSGQWSYTTSGNLYNQFVDSGYFFKIDPMERNTFATIQIEKDGGNTSIEGEEDIRIFYDYLYF